MAHKITRQIENWSYFLKSDRDLSEDQRSKFVLSPLSVSERAAVRDGILRVDSARGNTTRLNGQALEITLGHIVSIENFPAGEPQAWPEKRAEREKYLEMFADPWIQEIGDEVWFKSTVDSDLKNS